MIDLLITNLDLIITENKIKRLKNKKKKTTEEGRKLYLLKFDKEILEKHIKEISK